MSERTTRVLLLAIAMLAIAACAQANGVACDNSSQCDPGDACLQGLCQADQTQAIATVVIKASPTSQTVDARVGAVPAAATVTLTNEASSSETTDIACSGAGAKVSPSAVTLAKGKSATVDITFTAPSAAGTQTATCTAKSSDGKTTWATFTAELVASGSAGGGAGGGGGGGSAGGAAGGSGGSSGTGVGPSGGTVDHLYFAVIGDSRPPNADETSSYPSAIISKIHQDIEGLNPKPQFVVSTGDYMYASTSPVVSGSAALQAKDYMTAAAAWTGTFFPTMGNHECDGFVADNCTSTTQYPNITAFIGTILKASGQTNPYYSVPINSTNGSWSAKLVVVACNYWSTAQQTWLTNTLATPTTYTILVRHENADATTTPPCFPAVPNLMASAKYDLSLVGHVHDFSATTSSKEVVVGHGGAPLTSAYNGTYGFVTVEQLSTGWQIKNYDYTTALPVTTVNIPLQ